MKKIKILYLGNCGRSVFELFETDYDTIYISNLISLNNFNKKKPSMHLWLDEEKLGYSRLDGNYTTAFELIECYKDEILKILSDTEYLIIVCGLGGDFSSGSLVSISKLAKQQNIKTISIVSQPFIFEGKKRNSKAVELIKMAQPYIYKNIMLNNDEIFKITNKEYSSLLNMFKFTDKCFCNILTQVIYNIENNILINEQLIIENLHNNIKENKI